MSYLASEGISWLQVTVLAMPTTNEQKSEGREEAVQTLLAPQGGLFSSSIPGAPLCTWPEGMTGMIMTASGSPAPYLLSR